MDLKLPQGIVTGFTMKAHPMGLIWVSTCCIVRGVAELPPTGWSYLLRTGIVRRGHRRDGHVFGRRRGPKSPDHHELQQFPRTGMLMNCIAVNVRSRCFLNPQQSASLLMFYDGPTPPPGIFDDFLASPAELTNVSTRSLLSLIQSAPASPNQK